MFEEQCALFMNKLQNSDNCLKTKQERIVKYSLVKRSLGTIPSFYPWA